MGIDWLRLVIGILAIAFGAYSIFVRGKSTDSAKLNAIKKYWGEEKGTRIHFFAYGMVPIVAGFLMLYKALKDAF